MKYHILTCPLAKEEGRQVAFLIPLLLFIQDPLDNLVALVHILDTLLVDLILLNLLSGGFPFFIFTLEALIDDPDFVDVILDPLETLVALEERVEFIGIVYMGISFPFDVETLSDQLKPFSTGERRTRFSCGISVGSDNRSSSLE